MASPCLVSSLGGAGPGGKEQGEALISPGPQKESWQLVVATQDWAWPWFCRAGHQAVTSMWLPELGHSHAAGGPGRFRVLWGLQQCGQEWASRLSKKEAPLPVTHVGLGDTGVGGWLSHGAQHFRRSCY